MILESFNWFDVCVLLAIGIGCWRGYHRGASEQLLPVVKWVAIVLIAAYTHRPLGFLLSRLSGLHMGVCHAAVYLAELTAILILFGWIGRTATDRIIAAQLFGKIEHYLGLLMGGLSAAAFMLLIVAVLNAFDMTPARLWLKANPDDPSFNALVYTVAERVEQDVVEQSVWGICLRRELGFLLATPVRVGTPPKTDGTIEERRRLLDEPQQAR